mmetsp:Transcript_15506/g.10874  ORF Transcript_15506/g.10874 Transcript_15506/m.10874 type:complete len:106 (-) Transcript_15506:56-373(-)
MCRWENDQAQEFIALQLLLDFNGGNLAAKTEETPVEQEQKEEEEKVELAEGEKPKEVEKENEPLPDRSILLDPLLSTVGISNKAHKKTVNLIQILYIKTTPNAMV